MRNHLTTGRTNICLHIGISIQLGEKMINRTNARGESQSLISIIPRTPVSFTEDLCQSYLCQLLAITKNPELGLPCKYFLTPQQTDHPALNSELVIFSNNRSKIIKTKPRSCCICRII